MVPDPVPQPKGEKKFWAEVDATAKALGRTREEHLIEVGLRVDGYKQHLPLAIRTAAKLLAGNSLLNHLDPVEVADEVFLNLHRYLARGNQIQDEAKLPSFLVEAVRREITEQARAKARRPEDQFADKEAIDRTGPPLRREDGIPGGDLSNEVFHTVLLHEVEAHAYEKLQYAQAVSALNPDESVESLAERLGKSVPAIKSGRLRGKLKLRDFIQRPAPVIERRDRTSTHLPR